jgi:hypothetical protein
MKSSHRGIALLLAGTAAFAGWTSSANADETVVVVAREPERPVRSYGPNALMLQSGLVIFGLSYGTAVVVAAESSHTGDKSLYIPLIGPWIDLGNRGPSCPVGDSSCNHETTNRVLIVVDGIFQAVGALDIIGALLIQPTVVEERRAAKTKPHVSFAPWATPTGYGLSAAGAF